MDQLVEAINSVSTKEGFDLRTTDSKLALAKVLMDGEQTPNSIVHRFGGGLYIREAHYPAGTVIVGQEHVSEHMNVLLKGSINVIDGEGQVQTLTAPHMFVAKAGSKVGYTLEDVVWQNIYVTNSTDVEYLESVLFKAPDILKQHQQEKLIKEYPLYEEDRKDFFNMVEESGWTIEDIELASKHREDCIPFPDGSYSICAGDSPIQGKGMFSTAVIKQHSIIAPMRLGGCRTPAGYLINHSKSPNATAFMNDLGDMFLVALRDIDGMAGGDLGEEITLDYKQVMQINNLWKGTNKCLLESH
ncbi:SET domain containing protein [uncultured Caudovirales phage]|uniref:SET domain containing protein n=1 Tax=uncultured Caudovirales phage TaxID=2100421 RepID=A0A6J5L955_9CAUD|nr:SET domain containing protein [uncultured Caudovirales phage]